MIKTSASVHPLGVVAAILAALGIAAALACTTTPSPSDATPANSAADPAFAETEQAGGTDAAGVSDDWVLFGQSAAFTGPAAELGNGMRTGILAAFNEANAEGGVHGRELRLESLNDSYEADFAFSNTRDLIDKTRVFALIGAVGTPTARAATPQAHVAGVPFIAPFTGAAFLREPYLDNVLNLRASYYQETDEMVARELGEAGEGVYVTQVVPLPQDGDIPVVARYHAALADYDPDAEPGFVSLEGYLAGRLAIAGLEACGRELTRKCFLDGAHNAGTIDIDGFRLRYEPGDDNQGSDTVFLTVIGADGQYRQVDKLGSDSSH